MANLHTAWLLPTRAGIRAGFRAAQRATGGLLAPRAAGTTVARRIGLGLGAKIGVGVGVLCSPRRRWAAASCSAAPVTAGLPALVATAVEDGNGASWIGVAVAAIQRAARVVGRTIYLGLLFVPPLSLGPLLGALVWLAPAGLIVPVAGAWWAWLRLCCEFGGPTFIKLGQWASMRRDLFSEIFCNEFSKLHDESWAHAWPQTQATLDEQFGAGWEDRLDIEPIPVGSGCVAQVYRGVVEEMVDGQPVKVTVAVKVIHPTIKRMVADDINILRIVMSVAELVPGSEWLGLSDALEEFNTLITTQMDLTVEAANLERFIQNFDGISHVRFPRPIRSFTTPSVLTETFEEGVPVSKLVDNYPEAVCKQAGVIICDLYLRMLFAHNFSHGDMHPGNILITGADSVETVGVTLLDAGIVTNLDDTDQLNFVDLFRAIMSRDGRRAGELMLERSRSQRCEDPDAFVSGIEALVDEALSAGLMLENLKVGQLLMRVLTLSCSNRVGLETNFTSVAIAIMVLEALGRSLNPQQDILKAARPYLVKRQLGII